MGIAGFIRLCFYPFRTAGVHASLRNPSVETAARGGGETESLAGTFSRIYSKKFGFMGNKIKP